MQGLKGSAHRRFESRLTVHAIDLVAIRNPAIAGVRALYSITVSLIFYLSFLIYYSFFWREFTEFYGGVFHSVHYNDFEY